jgi:ABC-type uncharacterized transport system permease subunit
MSDATAPSLAARFARRPRLDPTRSLAMIFMFTGLYLIFGVAPFIDSETARLALEPGRDVTGISLNPQWFVFFVGVVYVLLAIAGFMHHRVGERRVKFLYGVGAVLFLPLVVVLALALSDRGSTNVLSLLVESLRLGTPIALGALAGLWSERSGVVNIGIEGMMLAGAGIGFMVYSVLGEATEAWALWVAVLAAVLVGGLMAALHAMLSITFKVDQIISGVVINLLALGTTSFIRSEIIVPGGNESGQTLPEWEIPLLSDIPIVGEEVFVGQPIFYSMFVIYILTWIVLYKTPWGLRVRSCGENPHAAETLGINVIKVRYMAVILGGLIAGLGGAWFSLEQAGSFADNMTNGAGFIALAALIFGKWTPLGAFGGAMLFGFSRALGTRLQILEVEVSGFSIPSEFMQSVPFVVTIIVLAGVIGRAIPPAAVGQPFERSR